MITTVEGVVLRVVSYSDQVSIATLYTDLWGATAFSIPIGGRGKSRGLSSLVQPLRVLQLTTPSPTSHPVKRIRDVRLLVGSLPLAHRPICSSYFLYLAQLLRELLVQEPEDSQLYATVYNALDLLDSMEDPAQLNGFDLALLVSILRVKGYLPVNLNGQNPDEGTGDYWLDLQQWLQLPIKTDKSVQFTSRLRGALPRLLQYDLETFAPNVFSLAEYKELRHLLLLFAEVHSPAFKVSRILPLP